MKLRAFQGVWNVSQRNPGLLSRPLDRICDGSSFKNNAHDASVKVDPLLGRDKFPDIGNQMSGLDLIPLLDAGGQPPEDLLANAREHRCRTVLAGSIQDLLDLLSLEC